MGDDGDAAGSVIAQRLDHLLATAHPAGRGPYLLREITDGINEAAGEQVVSVAYLSQLRLGQRKTPSFRILEAIAQFFGVPSSYFSDELTAAQADQQLEFLQAMHDAGVRTVALRAAGLSEKSLAAVKALIDSARELEGLDPADGGQPGNPGQLTSDNPQ
jgi:transcriptional regulator with XRE-family HTH domain